MKDENAAANEMEKKFEVMKVAAQTKSSPAYVVNIPVKVTSDSENETSSGEEAKKSYPKDYYNNPQKYFRLFPSKVKTFDKKGKQKTKKIYQRGKIVEGFIPDADIQPKDESKDVSSRLIKQFEEESFKNNATESKNEAKQRMGLVLGFNKMRSLSASRNRTLDQHVNQKTISEVPVRKIGFFWDGAWEKYI